MALKISKELKTGIVATLAIALLIYGLNILKGRNLFSRTYTVYAVYHNVGGLVVTNPVQLNGYKVGQVKDINLMPDHSGRIVVEMLITESDLKIPRKTNAKIVSLDLLGTKAVSLFMSDTGTAALSKPGEYLVNKDTLQGSTEEGLKEGVSRTLAPFQLKAQELMSSMDSVMEIVELILNKDARANLSKSFEHITVALASLEKTALRVDTLVVSEKYRLHSIFVNIDHITLMLSQNSEKLGNILKNMSSISDSLAKSKITSTINNASSALANASAVLDKINKGQGSLGLLVNDKKLYYHLDSASADLDRLLIDLKAHPARYVHLSLISRKEKKSGSSKKAAVEASPQQDPK